MEGLINPDTYITASGVQIANTFVTLGSERAICNIVSLDPEPIYSASTNMQIYRDQTAFRAGLVPVESRFVTYNVADPSAVYNLLYGSAQVVEGWANATVVHVAPAAANGNAVAVTGEASTATANEDPTADASVS